MVSERSQKRLFILIFAPKFSFLPSYSQKLSPPAVYGVDDASFYAGAAHAIKKDATRLLGWRLCRDGMR